MKNKRIITVTTIALFIAISLTILINVVIYKPTKSINIIEAKTYNAPANSAFNDDNFYKCVIDAYNSTNGTSVAYTENLTDEQLKTITNLNCKNKSISSASGIEKLTNLKSLNLSENQLTSLDISSNTELTSLYASQNQLTNLDVSKNTKLTYISIENNQLTSFDISTNTKLGTLYIYKNKLTGLNVDNNTELRNLYAYENQLTTLDISKNTKLTNLSVSQNQITNLDVSKNVELKTFSVGKNKLTNIDVSKNPKLTNISVSQNQITNLDVSKNTELTSLFASSTQLTNLDIIENFKLEKLEIHNTKLKNLDVSKNPKLTSLIVSQNQLTSLDVSKNPELTNLTAYQNQLTSLDVSKNPKLILLSISENQLTNLDVSNNLELKTLSVYKNQLTTLDVSKNPKLTSLSVSQNQLINLDVSKNPELTSLSASQNQLINLNVINNPKLTTLYIEKNQIKNIDVSKSPKLTHLTINDNKITSLDVSNNPELLVLYVENNQLTNLDVSKNGKLANLKIYGNQLPNLDISHNPKLNYLIIEPSPFIENIVVNKNETTKLPSNKVILPSGKTATITTVSNPSSNLEFNKTDNTIKCNELGNYTLEVTYKHNVSSSVNTYRVLYNIKVVDPILPEDNNIQDNRSTNNYLSTLTLSAGEINFNKSITGYSVEVDTDKITINASLEDSKASFVKDYGPRTVNLNYGKNTIKIKVKSEKGNEKEYVINVTRKDIRSGNNNLSNITLSNASLTFDKSITEYQVPVEYEVEMITVSAIAEDTKSKVEFPNKVNLELGNNEILIKVTAENETTKQYKINVIRKEKNQVLDNNNYLNTLNIAGYDINFNKDKLNYEVVIKEETKLDITYTPESTKSVATLTGNEDLKDGSIIKISVYAEDGTLRQYTITVKIESKKTDIPLPIAIGVFAVGMLAFIGSVCYIKSR